jgi:copper transporter 1
MNMATSAMAISSSTSTDMSGMATSSATASASSDMSGMSHVSGMSGMMDMSQMMMTFFTSTETPLYSKDWTPDGAGQYAGTCISLIALAFIFRGLLALRMRLPMLWNRRMSVERQDDAKDLEWDATATDRAKEPWRVNEALARAILDTILAGVSYLL